MSFLRYERNYKKGWADAELGVLPRHCHENPETIKDRAYKDAVLDYQEGVTHRYDAECERFPVSREETAIYATIEQMRREWDQSTASYTEFDVGVS